MRQIAQSPYNQPIGNLGELMKKLMILLLTIPSICFALKYVPVQIVAAGDMSTAEIDSLPIDMNQIVYSSIQAVFTGAPVGTLKLQFSDDLVQMAQPSSCSAVVNWTDYTGSSQAISAAGNFAYNILDSGYRCLRLVYTKTSGTGSLNATFSGKGW